MSIISANHDYFSLPKLYYSDLATPLLPRLRISLNTNPHEMLDQVRNSINSKSKSGTAKDATKRGHAAISEFRQTVDQKRAMAQINNEYLGLKLASSSVKLAKLPALEIPVYNALNLSHSSLESEVFESPPAIMVEEMRRRGRNVTPIPVPPSPNAVARAAVPDILAQMSLSPPSVPDVSRADTSLKVRRKPPPDMVEDQASLSESLGYTDVETEEESKFPQFPRIAEKRRGLFQKKTKNTSEPPELEEHDAAPDLIPSRSVTPAQPLVRLKTTMRKTKKKTFDENKPWKNHSELDYVSEQQRKRYEGVWVSNKGQYMNRVVTRLVGVDYDKDESKKILSTKKILSEKEVSERAAMLSSKVTDDNIPELHGLTSVKTHELIHGIVVKRIWSRSKLPQETLALVWELVDYRKDGTLNKVEFIVGMWLVDQCLYGRKLPKLVDELVWASLGSIGISVVVKKKRR